MDTFVIMHFALDGELLGTATLARSRLSPKWLNICASMLEAGPILSLNMGSTLSHFDIECAAGLCLFKVHGKTLYVGALLAGSSAYDRALIKSLSARTSLPETLFASDTRPLFLIVHDLAAEVPEEDREPMFQLAYHFAAAYFEWLSAATASQQDP